MSKDKFQEEVLNVDVDGCQVSSVLTSDGRFEQPDPVPMEPPVGYNPPPDIVSMIKSMVRNERLMYEISKQGYETFEEAEDFDIEDDPPDPLTDYEKVFEPPPARDGVGVNGGGPVTPTAEAAPVQVSKPDVSVGSGSNSEEGSHKPDS